MAPRWGRSVVQSGLALVAAMALVAACRGGGGAGAGSTGASSADATTAPSTTSTASTATPSTSAPAGPAGPAVTLPSTPVGTQLTWVLTQGRAASDQEIANHVAPAFLAQVPAVRLRQVLTAMGSPTVVSVAPTSTATRLVADLTTAAGPALTVTIQVDPATNAIVGLVFGPTTPPAPTSWDGVDQRVAALAPGHGLLVGAVATDGTIMPLHGVNSELPAPLGSAFKLYVLGALTDAITAGTVHWTDTVTVRDVDKSLPSGQLQDQPDGTTVSVQDAATKMISISDNTAADLLAALVGRAAVEDQLAKMGMGDASRRLSLPWLTTRELFILKWGVDAATRSAYEAADGDQRRRLLAALPTTLPPVSAIHPNQPVDVDELEWFATPAELAAAQVRLDQRRADPALAPLATIMSTNPGAALDRQEWPYVAFKGGSEPGVLTLSWLLQRQDGQRFVVVVTASSPNTAVDEADAVSVGNGIIGLLAAA